MESIRDILNIHQISDSNLSLFISELEGEEKRRQRERRRTALVDDFNRALNALRDAGITVYTSTTCIECGDDVTCDVNPDTVYFCS